MRRFFIISGSVVVSFLLGYGIVFLEKRQLEQSSEATRQQLQAALDDSEERAQIGSVANQLGVILIEVEQNNYGNAQELATQFFDDLNELSRSAHDASTRERLSQVVRRRDEITTDLATLNAETKTKLQAIYTHLVSVASAE